MTQPTLLNDLTPADDREVVLEADWTARRDAWGRIQFFAYWWPGRFWCPDKPSAQCFFGNPEEHAEHWADLGYSVRAEQAA